MQGSWQVAGIAEANYGWLYNSYNVGILEDDFGTPNKARYMAGITNDNVQAYGGAIKGSIENCYSMCSFMYSSENTGISIPCQVDTICNEDHGNHVIGCYYYHPNYTSRYSEKVDLEIFCSSEMISKLNQGIHNVMPSWIMDNQYINNGFPINVADINYQEGIYKRIPEVWVSPIGNELSDDLSDGTCKVSLSMYFNDSVPVVSLDTPELGEVEYQGDEKGGNVVVTLNKVGTGNLIIEFPETEYICQSTYAMKLNITSSAEDSTPKPSCEPSVSPDVSSVPSTASPSVLPSSSTKPSALPSVPSVDSTSKPLASPTIINSADDSSDIILEPGESVDDAEETMEVGQTFIKNKMKYKITKYDKNGTREVALIGTTRKKSDSEFTTLIIRNNLAINGMSFKITSIGKNAFSGYRKLKSISIGKSTIDIGSRAFYKCTALKKITIPSEVIKIGKQAFYGCKKLKNIIIKTKRLKTKNVGKKAFYGIATRAKINVPKTKLKPYKKLLKSRGVGLKVKIKN